MSPFLKKKKPACKRKGAGHRADRRKKPDSENDLLKERAKHEGEEADVLHLAARERGGTPVKDHQEGNGGRKRKRRRGPPPRKRKKGKLYLQMLRVLCFEKKEKKSEERGDIRSMGEEEEVYSA